MKTMAPDNRLQPRGPSRARPKRAAMPWGLYFIAVTPRRKAIGEGTHQNLAQLHGLEISGTKLNLGLKDLE